MRWQGWLFCCILQILTLQAQAKSPRASLESTEQAIALKNRFRVDYMIDSITLIVHRKFNSEGIVLVLPDGTKWYSYRHPKNVKWATGKVGDMIQIFDPMPGPWQVLGSVEENSFMKVYSSIGVHVDELPAKIFRGEQLKVTAHLYGEHLPIRMKGLDYMLDWTVRITGEKKPTETSFETGTVTIGTYRDDGSVLDEAPDDGMFTADFNLNHPAGTYLLQVDLVNEIFARQYQQYIDILPKPAKLDYQSNILAEKEKWFVILEIDERMLDISRSHATILINGPEHSMEEIIVIDLYGGRMLYPSESISQPGSYRIKGTVYATTPSGREFIFEMDSVLFSVEESLEVVSEEELNDQQEDLEELIENMRESEDGTYAIRRQAEEFLEGLERLRYIYFNPDPENEMVEIEAERHVLQLVLMNLGALLSLALLIPVIMPRKESKKSKKSKKRRRSNVEKSEPPAAPAPQPPAET